MHHFRERLLDGDRTRLDPANVYIQYHNATAGVSAPGWHGYLPIAPDEDLGVGETYTLALAVGRSGSLRIASLAPIDDGKVRAIFAGVGPLA